MIESTLAREFNHASMHQVCDASEHLLDCSQILAQTRGDAEEALLSERKEGKARSLKVIGQVCARRDEVRSPEICKAR